MIWRRAFKSLTSEGIFPNGAKKWKVSTNLWERLNKDSRD